MKGRKPGLAMEQGVSERGLRLTPQCEGQGGRKEDRGWEWAVKWLWRWKYS